jgi:predicted MFS family arabinose efflux permease
MGVGLGIAASGTLVPLLLQHGLARTWAGLALLSFALTLMAWFGWPAAAAPAPAPRSPGAPALPTGALRAICLEYALNAVGLVPHMIFLVDFVARELGQGLAAGAGYWVLFGVGAVFGPLIGGLVADQVGFKVALRLALLAQAIALWLTALGAPGAWLIGSSIAMGAFTPGIVGLVLGRIDLLLEQHPEARAAAWSKATISFAVFQAAAAYGMSFLLIRGGGHHLPLFAVGGAALLVALCIDLAGPARVSRSG